jgi:hypothetical protein
MVFTYILLKLLEMGWGSRAQESSLAWNRPELTTINQPHNPFFLH